MDTNTNREVKMADFDMNARIEEFYTYDEISKLVDEGEAGMKASGQEVDGKLAGSSLLLGIANRMDIVQRMVLENLTGQTLDTQENIYEYLTLALKINAIDVAKMGMALMADSNPDMLGDLMRRMMDV